MACICIGLICFIYYCHCMASQKRTSRKAIIILNILLWIVFTYLSAAICLRGYVSNHLPLSNGFETMQFMAWCTLLLTFLLQRKFAMLLPFGFLLCGLTLMVSMLGESNPQITQLMPVLQSPLLSIHVVVIMIAYSLLAFIMLNGVTAVILHQSQKECKRTNRTIADNKPNNSLSGNFLTRYRYFHWCCMGKRIMGTLLGMGS